MLRGQEQLRCGCGTVTSTVEAPTGVCATAVSKPIMLCCSTSLLLWTIFVWYARGSHTLSKWTNTCRRHGKKSIRDPKFVGKAPDMAGHVLQVNDD